MNISTTWGYAVLILFAMFVYGYSHVRPQQIAPFSWLMDAALQSRVSRFSLIMIWLWIGWHFLFDR